ncbi:hypothetical protein MBLNU230_g8656t1 [Neophaeotheca triangularis]
MRVKQRDVTCFVYVEEGDRITVDGQFSGSAKCSRFDLLIDGSFVCDRVLGDSKKEGLGGFSKKAIPFVDVFDTIDRDDGSNKVVEGSMIVQALPEMEYNPQGTGNQLGVGSIAVIVSLGKNSKDRYQPHYPDSKSGSWIGRDLTKVHEAGVAPEFDIAIEPHSSELPQDKQSKHLRHVAQERFGVEPRVKFIFYYRSRDAIMAAGCVPISGEPIEIPIQDTVTQEVSNFVNEEAAIEAIPEPAPVGGRKSKIGLPLNLPKKPDPQISIISKADPPRQSPLIQPAVATNVASGSGLAMSSAAGLQATEHEQFPSGSGLKSLFGESTTIGDNDLGATDSGLESLFVESAVITDNDATATDPGLESLFSESPSILNHHAGDTHTGLESSLGESVTIASNDTGATVAGKQTPRDSKESARTDQGEGDDGFLGEELNNHPTIVSHQMDKLDQTTFDDLSFDPSLFDFGNEDTFPDIFPDMQVSDGPQDAQVPGEPQDEQPPNGPGTQTFIKDTQNQPEPADQDTLDLQAGISDAFARNASETLSRKDPINGQANQGMKAYDNYRPDESDQSQRPQNYDWDFGGSPYERQAPLDYGSPTPATQQPLDADSKMEHPTKTFNSRKPVYNDPGRNKGYAEEMHNLTAKPPGRASGGNSRTPTHSGTTSSQKGINSKSNSKQASSPTTTRHRASEDDGYAATAPTTPQTQRFASNPIYGHYDQNTNAGNREPTAPPMIGPLAPKFTPNKPRLSYNPVTQEGNSSNTAQPNLKRPATPSPSIFSPSKRRKVANPIAARLAQLQQEQAERVIRLADLAEEDARKQKILQEEEAKRHKRDAELEAQLELLQREAEESKKKEEELVERIRGHDKAIDELRRLELEENGDYEDGEIDTSASEIGAGGG